MAVNTQGVKEKLAQKALTTTSGPKPPEVTIQEYLQEMAPAIKQALPKHLSPDRLLRIAMTTIRTTPKLLQCNVESLMAAVMEAAQLGLEPGILGHCYIIPYGSEATFVIGYRGMIDLARRSGNIESIYAHEVYENDYFKLRYGLDEELVHIPWHLREDTKPTKSGDIRGAYMVAKFKDGGYYIHYMPKAEIDEHRKRSKAANSGPWVTDYIEMAKKTVVRSAWKWLPISVEIMRQVEAADETVKTDIAPDMADVPALDDGVIDITPMPTETQQNNQGTEAETNEVIRPVTDQATRAQIGKINGLANDLGIDKAGLLQVVKDNAGREVADIAELDKREASTVIQYLLEMQDVVNTNK